MSARFTLFAGVFINAESVCEFFARASKYDAEHCGQSYGNTCNSLDGVCHYGGVDIRICGGGKYE